MSKKDGRLTEKEISRLIQALKANVKVASRSGEAIKARLRAELETQLNTLYPVHSDPVWLEQYDRCLAVWKECQSKVAARSDELGIPDKFRPAITPPDWRAGWMQMIKELRAAMRREAYARIDELIKERLEDMERESARVQLEIIAAGNLTDTARKFLEQLPKIEKLMPPIDIKEVSFALIGREPLKLYDWDKRRSPEYLPDLQRADDDEGET